MDVLPEGAVRVKGQEERRESKENLTSTNALVTNELRGRSNEERELVEGENAVDLVESGAVDLLHIAGARDVSTPPERASSPVSAKRLEHALNTERGRRALAGNARALEFLDRPYHELNRNRFLFCEASEADSYTNNRASGWNDAIAIAQLADGQIVRALIHAPEGSGSSLTPSASS